ncbi:MAG: pantetheine-phosphate adenylyltransferase [Bacteroidetes bacterium]|nr:pantetheine-phosphate adenylyltransferase [Bacteroidota bacterium]
MKTAIYPFSGDPITFGHIDIITRAADIFDRVIAAIGINPLKEYSFTIEERVAMAREALSALPNVEVACYKDLLADFARERGTNVVIRGIRNTEDFDYEWMLNQINESIDHTLETFWMPCKKDKEHISSSAVKKMWQGHENIAGMVPESVVRLLAAKA